MPVSFRVTHLSQRTDKALEIAEESFYAHGLDQISNGGWLLKYAPQDAGKFLHALRQYLPTYGVVMHEAFAQALNDQGLLSDEMIAAYRAEARQRAKDGEHD